MSGSGGQSVLQSWAQTTQNLILLPLPTFSFSPSVCPLLLQPACQGRHLGLVLEGPVAEGASFIAWELQLLPRFPSPYAPSNTGTSSRPLSSHLPTSSLPSSHGHLSTVSHLPPVFIPPPQGEETLEGLGKVELWGVLTTMWLMETQQSGGKSCSMGTRNCRQPSQWHSSSIIPMRLKMRTTALARS